MAVDIYRVIREHGESKEVSVKLNNENWRRDKRETAKELLQTPNRQQNNFFNPYVRAYYVKRTI